MDCGGSCPHDCAAATPTPYVALDKYAHRATLCTYIGLLDIKDSFECEDAAFSLGFRDHFQHRLVHHDESDKNRPRGCYRDTKGLLHYNSHATGSGPNILYPQICANPRLRKPTCSDTYWNAGEEYIDCGTKLWCWHVYKPNAPTKCKGDQYSKLGFTCKGDHCAAYGSSDGLAFGDCATTATASTVASHAGMPATRAPLGSIVDLYTGKCVVVEPCDSCVKVFNTTYILLNRYNKNGRAPRCTDLTGFATVNDFFECQHVATLWGEKNGKGI